jgi:hypothetical protein
VRRILNVNPTYIIDTTTSIQIPLRGKYEFALSNPSLLYDSLTQQLVESVGNGYFNTFLVAASIALNSSSTQNAILMSLKTSPMILIQPPNNQNSRVSNNYNISDLSIFLITVSVLIGIMLILIFSIIVKKKCKTIEINYIQINI